MSLMNFFTPFAEITFFHYSWWNIDFEGFFSFFYAFALFQEVLEF